MQSLFAADECHYLPVDALCADHIAFFIARQGNAFLGTAALADMTDYGELKSMFVTPKARGGPVARALLRQIEDQARDAKRTTLKLETGDRLVAAQAFYRREGVCADRCFRHVCAEWCQCLHAKIPFPIGRRACTFSPPHP